MLLFMVFVFEMPVNMAWTAAGSGVVAGISAMAVLLLVYVLYHRFRPKATRSALASLERESGGGGRNFLTI
jgi:L-lactate permease